MRIIHTFLYFCFDSTDIIIVMNSEVFFNNQKYISAKEAGFLTGYSKDYIGRLCREGIVVSKRIGKAWYVEENSLLDYKDSPISFDFSQNFQGAKDIDNGPVMEETSSIPASELVTTPNPLTLKSKPYYSKTLKPLASLVLSMMLIVGGAYIQRVDVPSFSKNLSQKISELPEDFYRAVNSLGKNISSEYLSFGENILSGIDGIGSIVRNPGTLTASLPVGIFDAGSLSVYHRINSIFNSLVYNPLSRLFTPEPDTVYVVTNTPSSPSTTVSGSPASQSTTTIINQPVIERVREIVTTIPSGLKESDVDLKLNQLENKIVGGVALQFSRLSSGSGGPITNIYQQIADIQKISNLYNTTITGGNINSMTISGGSIGGATISATTLTAQSFSTPTITLSGTGANSILSTDATGNIVSTTTPTIAGFNATSTTATSTISTGGLVVGDSHFLIQQNSGRIAIGTTTPQSQLEIFQSTNGTPIFSVYRNTDLAPTGDFMTYKSKAGTTLFRVDNSGNLLAGGIVTSGSQTITSVSTPQFRLQYDASNEITFSTGTTGSTTIATNGTNSSLSFTPQNNQVNAWNFTNAAGNSILNIDSTNQRVGISSTTPNNKLDVNGNVYFTGTGFFGGAITATSSLSVTGFSTFANSTTTYASFTTASTTNLILNGSSFNNLLGTGLKVTSGALTFDTSVANTFTSLQKFNASASSTNLSANFAEFGGTATTTFTSDGSIGVGSTTPGYKLSVTGSAYFDGGTLTASVFTATSSITTPNLTLTTPAINSILSTNADGLLTATSTPTFGSFNATSTTATSTIAGFLDVLGTGTNATSTYSSNLWVKGTLQTGTGSMFLSDTGLTSSDGNLSIQRNNNSYLNGGNFGLSSTTPGYKLSIAGSAYFDGGTVTASSLIATSSSSFATSNGSTLNVGTTTGYYPLTIASTTGPQLSLSAGAGLAQWTLANEGGQFFLGQTSTAGNATTSTTAISVLGNNYVGIGNGHPDEPLDVRVTTDQHLVLRNAESVLTLQTHNDGATVLNSMGFRASSFNFITGPIYITDTSNSDMTVGLSINQSGNDNQILGLRSTDIAHGLTTLALTETFADFRKISANNGGLQITTLSDTDAQAFLLRGVMGSTDPTDSTSAVKIIGAKSDGNTSLADLGSTETVFQIANNDNTAGFTILGSDFVGIATTTPYYSLTIASTTGPQLALSAGGGLNQWTFGNIGGNFYLSTTTVAGNATTSTSALTIIGSSGNVGIGTTNPGALLQVRSANGTLTGNNANTNAALKHQIAAYTSDSYGIDIGASMGLGGYYGSAGSYATFGAIAARKINATDGSTSGYLSFWTNLTGTGLTEKMRIDESGNVGIGTTGPLGLLQVSNTTSAGPASSGNATGKLIVGKSVDTVLAIGSVASDYAWLQSQAADSAGIFYDIALNPLGGNVGIGTTVPTSPLDITIPFAKTDTTLRNTVALGKSNESSGFAYLTLQMKGGASQAARYWSFQTKEDGVSNAGSIVFQPTDGNVGIGTTGPDGNLSIGALVPRLTFSPTTADNADEGGIYFREVSNHALPGVAGSYGIYMGLDGSTNVFNINAWSNNVNKGGISLERDTGEVGIGTTAPAATLHVKTLSTTTKGLLLNATASQDESYPLAELQYNGTRAVEMRVLSDITYIDFSDRNYGNNKNGTLVRIGRNTNAGAEGGTAGTLSFAEADGSPNWYIWPDATGDFRTYSSGPTGSTGSPTVSDTAGNVIGDQSSWYETKNPLNGDWENSLHDPTDALQKVLDTKIYDFRYTETGYKDVNDGEPIFTGAVIFDKTEWFGKNYGRQQNPALNEINIAGYTVLAIQELSSRTSALQTSTTTPSIYVTSSSYIGIGTSTPQAPLHIYSNSLSGGVATFENANASCTIDPTNSSLTCSSDEKLKKDIVTIDTTTTLNKLLQLRPVTYHWKGEGETTGTHTGFIAQEVEQVFPEFVSTDSQGRKSVAYSNFIPAMVGAMQELNKRVDSIDTRLSVLEASSTAFSVNTGMSFSDMISEFQNQYETVGAKFVNGIAYFKNIVADRLTVGSTAHPTGITLYDEVTSVPYCLKMQNGAMVSVAGDCTTSAQTTNSNDQEQATSTPASDTSIPIIFINGDNPAQITVGSVYSDLGATVTDTNADGSVNNNLGLHFNVNGLDMNDISINTSATSTNTVVYSAVDGSGNWGYATRTVEVVQQ